MRIKIFVIALLVQLISFNAFAYDAYIDGIYYNIYDYEDYPHASVTNKNYSNSYSGNIEIPATIQYNGKTYNVTSIDDAAFYGCAVSSITIPNSVISIGESAFSGCTGLSSITIPNSVISIGAFVFDGCTGLSSITIPNSVISIGAFAFNGCTGLSSITIPNSVTSIGRRAFSRCSSLTSVTIPNSVTSIGESAFEGCTGLLSITIPNSVTSIGESAFNGCFKITDIYVVSSEPVDCNGIKTFECSSDVRDKYDVYNYAVLHVPMGTKERYAAAYEWRYFSKIKEDLDINGQVFYTTLSVNQAGDGYVKHYVKADEPYTIFIGSDMGLRINTVVYNGKDVTDQLIDGYFTTPNITCPSKISISFEQSADNVKSFSAEDNLHVYGNDGFLFVTGIEKPSKMSIYSLDGMLINTQMLESDTKIKLYDGVYIINVGERSFKVTV